MPCRCDSETHARTKHKDCPLNVKVSERAVTAAIRAGDAAAVIRAQRAVAEVHARREAFAATIAASLQGECPTSLQVARPPAQAAERAVLPQVTCTRESSHVTLMLT